MPLRSISTAIEAATLNGASHIDVDVAQLRGYASIESMVVSVVRMGLQIEINGPLAALHLVGLEPGAPFHGAHIRLSSGIAPNFVTLVLTKERPSLLR